MMAWRTCLLLFVMLGLCWDKFSVSADGYRAAEERCVIITHLEDFNQGNICQQLLIFLFLISIKEFRK
jgi:hypothetical protein